MTWTWTCSSWTGPNNTESRVSPRRHHQLGIPCIEVRRPNWNAEYFAALSILIDDVQYYQDRGVLALGQHETLRVTFVFESSKLTKIRGSD